ncbi:MAG TPA: sigma 54-interacting transcriptional regulator [Polyangiaceae bacterium]|nr:sigma 54-interacting transcriptional regulator [Polyangiaceae bacterium]
MAKIIVNGPDGRLEHEVQLTADEALLVGRSPNVASLPPAWAERAKAPQTRAVASASVSANHVAAWADGDGVAIEDLGSRNGTWLLLPKSQPIKVPAGDVVLQLVRTATKSSGDEPQTPNWSGPRDYAKALATSIKEWPRVRNLDLEVLVANASSSSFSPAAIPLASGEALELVPQATADANWSRILEDLWRWIARHNSVYEAEERTRTEGMILASPAIRAAHREVVNAAQGDASTLLLTGPSGAGKEMLAEVFHRHTGRSGPFVAINSSMLTKDLMRSELFGAEAGSFTGATRRIIGAVERAQGGTLFLDEIGEMPEDVQPMLLRFLDRREFESLGQYGKAQRADVRLVVATNKDLRAATRSGKFRADLWYRLSVHVVDVPPLRMRWEDVAAYLETTLAPGTQHSLHEALSEEAHELLREHAWEGNFRELTNFRERLPRGAKKGSVSAEACRQALERGSLRPTPPPSEVDPDSGNRADFGALASQATRAFVEDRGREPLDWNDQKEWNEKYLKPLLFHHLSGAGSHPPPIDDDALASLASRSATRVRADRGTALKQLGRYYARFQR